MGQPSRQQVTELRHAIDALMRRFKIAESGQGDSVRLNPVDLQTLLYVAENPQCTASEVAHHLGVVPTTMSSVADRLTRQKLLLRERVESNRRIVALSLTAEGKARARDAVEQQSEHCRQMLDQLLPEERDTFLALITKVAKNDV